MSRILFFGDSNTWGYDPADRAELRYPASVRWTDRLAEIFSEDPACPAEIINGGLNGRRVPTASFLAKYTGDLIAGYFPLSVFAVMLGTNDILLTTHPDAEAAAEKMEHLIRFLLEKREEEAAKEGSPFTILLIAPPCLFEGSVGETEEENGRLTRLREESRKLPVLYRNLAERCGIAFADASGWGIRTCFDGVHFSEEGHAVFAGKMEGVLRRILSERKKRG